MNIRMSTIKNALSFYHYALNHYHNDELKKPTMGKETQKFAQAVNHLYYNLSKHSYLTDRDLTLDEVYTLFCLQYSSPALGELEENLKYNLGIYNQHIANLFNYLHQKKLLTFSCFVFFNHYTYVDYYKIISIINYFYENYLLTPKSFTVLCVNKKLNLLLDNKFFTLLKSILENPSSGDQHFKLLLISSFNHTDNLDFIKELTEYNITHPALINYFINNQNNTAYLYLFKKLKNKNIAFLFYQVHNKLYNKKDLILLLDQLPIEKLKENFENIASNVELEKIAEVLLLENSAGINISLSHDSYKSPHFNFFIYITKALKTKNLLQEAILLVLIRSLKDIKNLAYYIFEKIMSFNATSQELAFDLYELTKHYIYFKNDALFLWIEENKHLTLIEKYRHLIECALTDYKKRSKESYDDHTNKRSFWSVLSRIFVDYDHLPKYIFHDLIFNKVNDLFITYDQIQLFHDQQTRHDYINFILTKSMMPPSPSVSDFTAANIFPDENTKNIFLDKYKKLLEHSPKGYQLEFDHLFKEYLPEFFFIFTIFNQKTFKLINKITNTSLIELINFLQILVNIRQQSKTHFLVAYLLNNLENCNFSSGKNLEEIFDIISALTTISTKELRHLKYYHATNILSDITSYLAKKNINEKKLLANLREALTQLFCKEIDIDPEMVYKKSIYSSSQIKSLMLARIKFRANNYIGVLNELLKEYYTNNSLDIFLHDTKQKNELGKKIAKNNIFTREELLKHKINIDMYFHYPYIHQFNTGGEKAIESDVITKNIWMHINNILGEINICHDSDSSIHTLKKQLLNFQKQINKSHFANEADKLEFIRNPVNMHLLTKKILPLLDHLLILEVSNQLSTLSNNMMEDIQQLSILMQSRAQTSANEAWKKSKEFTIKVWDKNDPHTLFLGNYFGCCIATDGTQFPAIIQRTIDDAMMIITVIDESLKEPIAGLWLYLATDKKENFLVANFTEMRASIGEYDYQLRNIILAKMLAFADSYAKAINATFKMAQLKYGSLPKWEFNFNFYELHKMGVMTIDPSYDHYYLQSIKRDKFFHYKKEKADKLYADSHIITHIMLDKKEALKNTSQPITISPILQQTLFKPPASVPQYTAPEDQRLLSNHP